MGYHDEHDLIAKIKYYLSHPDEAQQIANAGRLRCLQEHTWARRLEKLFKQMTIHPNRSWGQ